MRILNWMLHTILLALSFSFLQCACAETSSGESPQTFVQSFYNWYAPIALKNGSLSAVDITIKEKAQFFSQKLYGYLAEDSNARKEHRGSTAGLDFDPFLATQDPCGEYEVGNTTQEGEKLRLEIYEICAGKKRTNPNVEVVLSKRDNQWVIDDFYYPPFGASEKDLLATLKALKQAREKIQN